MAKCKYCGSYNVEKTSSAEQSVPDKIGNAIGGVLCIPGCIIPGVHYYAAKQAGKCFSDASKSASNHYRCKSCGKTWSETNWD